MKHRTLLLLGLIWGCGGNVDDTTGNTSPGTAGTAGQGSGGSSAGAGGSGVAGQATAGQAGQGTAGQSTAGTGSGGSGQAGTGVGGSGVAGSGVAGSGVGGTGVGGSGTAGAGGATGPCEAAKPLPDMCDCIPPSKPAGFYWDGSTCAGLFACCPEMEKGTLYKTQEACVAEHQSCSSCAPTTLGPDPCDCDPGKKIYWWDGKGCQEGLVCCPQANGKIYDNPELCKQEHASCPQVECVTENDCPQPNCPPCTANCPVPSCIEGKCVMQPAGTGCGPTCPPECTSGCGYTDKMCGQGSQFGQVACLTPATCGNETAPVCGCNGVVYQNICQANNAGVDLSQLGNCATPPGYFECGDHFCKSGSEYCQRQLSDIGGYADDYTCEPIPAGCSAPGGDPCSCYKGVPCGLSCQLDLNGNVTVSCGGG